MMKSYSILFFWFLSVLTISCSSDLEECCLEKEIVKTSSHRISSEQAAQNALNFVSNIYNSTRSEQKSFTISDVKAINGYVDPTRAQNDSVSFDSLFYVVSFEDNQGFVIAASDDREQPIFAYVESGTYEDASDDNPGFERFLGNLYEKEYAERIKDENKRLQDDPDIDNPRGGTGGVNPNPDMFEIMYPLLATKWNQTFYKKYCPKNYTGCVVTAVSQICSYLRSPNQVSWSSNYNCGVYPIDWNSIITECICNHGNVKNETLKGQVSALMRFWGVVFDADYEDGGTGVDSEYAVSQMQQLGMNVTDLIDYDGPEVVRQLKKGNKIVFMRGNGRYYHVGFVFRKYVDGHAWVVDGCIESVHNHKTSYYVHCNWGWGGLSNGYFLSNVLNAEEKPYYDDYGDAITRGQNYQYKLRYAVVSK